MNNFQINKDKISGDTTQSVIQSFQLDKQGEVIPIESNSDCTGYQWLDMYCGIDWLLKTKTDHVLGIAARIQLTSPEYYQDPFNTFTIRYETEFGNKTEFAKRTEAIEKGFFYPYYTLQAYVQRDNPSHVISGAIIKTIDLYNFAKNFSYKMDDNRLDNSFKIIKWSDLFKNNYSIYQVGIN